MLAFHDTSQTAQEVRAAALRVAAFRKAAYAKPAPVELPPAPVVKLAPSSTMTPQHLIDLVIAEAAAAQRVTVEDVMGRSRLGPCFLARQAAMVVLRRHTKMSLPHQGCVLHRDHTTILHACKKSKSSRKSQSSKTRSRRCWTRSQKTGMRPMSTDQFTTQIEAFLQVSDINRWQYVRRKKHRAVVVEHNGRHTFVFPCTSENWHAPRNLISVMRRRLGLRRASIGQTILSWPPLCPDAFPQLIERASRDPDIRLDKLYQHPAGVVLTLSRFQIPGRRVEPWRHASRIRPFGGPMSELDGNRADAGASRRIVLRHHDFGQQLDVAHLTAGSGEGQVRQTLHF